MNRQNEQQTDAQSNNRRCAGHYAQPDSKGSIVRGQTPLGQIRGQTPLARTGIQLGRKPRSGNANN